MNKKPDYVTLAVALANHIYEHHYVETPLIGSPPIKLFDDACCSNLQIPANILEKFKIVRSFDDSFRDHVFTCEPFNFRNTVEENIQFGCSYDSLVLGLICCAQRHNRRDMEIFRHLVAIGLCHTELKEVEVKVLPGYRVLQKGEPVLAKQIAWTDKKDFYDGIYANWPSLVA